MNTNYTSRSSFEFKLEILEPTTKCPFACTIHRKIFIWLESDSGTNSDNISIILFYKRKKITCEDCWCYHIQTKLPFCIFPIKFFNIFTITISCTVNNKRKISILILNFLERIEYRIFIAKICFYPIYIISRFRARKTYNFISCIMKYRSK